MAFGKKPGLMIAIGVGKKRPEDDMPGPESPESMPEGMDEAKELAEHDEPEGDESGVTFSELGFHDGSERCGLCKYFAEPSTCNRVGDEIPSDSPQESWCHAFSGEQGEHHMESDMAQEQPQEREAIR